MTSPLGPLGRIFLLLCSLLLLASCTKPTVFPRYLTVADVINNVKCELQQAIADTTPTATWLSPWTAEFTVVLQVQRRTGGTGDLTLVVPYVTPAPGLFTLVVGGGLGKTGQARMTFKFDAEDNIGLFMSENRCAYTQELRSRRNLAGETGLRVWFVNVIDGINKARIPDQTNGFSYDLEFTTTLEGHIRPSFETTYPSGRIFSGAFDINRNREDKHTLNVAFAPPPPRHLVSPRQVWVRPWLESRLSYAKQEKKKLTPGLSRSGRTKSGRTHHHRRHLTPQKSGQTRRKI